MSAHPARTDLHEVTYGRLRRVKTQSFTPRNLGESGGPQKIILASHWRLVGNSPQALAIHAG